VRYLRLPHLLEDLFAKLMDSYAKTDLLILDWGLVPLTAEQRRDMLELLDDRSMPVDKWHELIVDPTLADAILDRIIHNAHRICLKGDSMRKVKYHATFGHFGVILIDENNSVKKCPNTSGTGVRFDRN